MLCTGWFAYKYAVKLDVCLGFAFFLDNFFLLSSQLNVDFTSSSSFIFGWEMWKKNKRREKRKPLFNEWKCHWHLAMVRVHSHSKNVQCIRDYLDIFLRMVSTLKTSRGTQLVVLDSGLAKMATQVTCVSWCTRYGVCHL